MKHLTKILIILFAVTSCNFFTKKIEPKHQHLLGFKIKSVAELGSEKYFTLLKEAESGNLDIKYIDDIIYVSYYENLNACGQYDGNIEIKNDTIKLTVELTSDVVCTSLRIDKVTFIIDNPEKEKMVVLN